MSAFSQWAEARLADRAMVTARLGWKGLKAEEYAFDGPIFLAAPNLRGGRIDFDNVDHIPEWRYRESPEIQLAVGDVLLVKDGSTLGMSAMVTTLPSPATVNRSIAVIRPNASLSSGYLFYYINSQGFQRLICLKRAGLGVPHLFQADLREFRISIPPLPEQHRIADILTTLDESIQQTQALIAKYQQIKAGLMHDLFTRGVTHDGHLRPARTQAPLLYKVSPLGWIPKEWGIVQVNQYGSVQLGRQRSPDQFSGRWATPYLRVANVFDGFIDFNDVLEMDFTPSERRKFSLKKGDILLNEGQSLELVGRCALFDTVADQFCFQNTLVRFRTYEPHRPCFCRWLFKWFLDCGFFKRIASQTTSVAHLGADRFAHMRCVLVPLDEQERISERLDALQTVLDVEEKRGAKLLSIKHGLIHNLLTGLVRVNVTESTTV